MSAGMNNNELNLKRIEAVKEYILNIQDNVQFELFDDRRLPEPYKGSGYQLHVIDFAGGLEAWYKMLAYAASIKHYDEGMIGFLRSFSIPQDCMTNNYTECA